MSYVNVRNDLMSIGVTSVNLSNEPKGQTRKSIIITNTSTAAQVITLSKGDMAAISNHGIRLSPGQSYTESTSEGFKCYQGGFKAISDAALGQVSIQEDLE